MRHVLGRLSLCAIIVAAATPADAGSCDMITAARLDDYLAGSSLAGLGELFVCKANKWNVDPRLLVAIAKHETGLGTLGPCARYNNPFGWFYCGAESCVPPNCTPCEDDDPADMRCQRSPYSCWARAVSQVTKFLGRNYLDAGLTTIPAIQESFCKSDCDAWIQRVEGYMQDLGGDPAVLRPSCPFPALDNFERVTLGSGWTSLGWEGSSGCTIVDNSDLGVGPPNPSGGVCYWNADLPNTQPTRQFACGLLSGAGADGDASVCVGVQNDNTMVCCGTDYVDGGWAMYGIAHNSYVGGFIHIGDTPTLGPGDYIGIERSSPTTFVCSKSTDGRTWIPLMEKTHDSIPDPGFLGADFQTNPNPFTLELWEGGNGALPTGIGRRCGCEDGTPEFECG